jgi:C1A family cysteine protease
MGNSVSYVIHERNKLYGWNRDLPDHRDVFHQFGEVDLDKSIINMVDLRSKCPEVYDQGTLGSCTANGIGGAYHFDELRQNSLSPFIPSRLFIYYNERAMEGTIESDSGASIRDGIKSIATVGVCDEKDWIYNIQSFTLQPSQLCYDSAKNNKAIQYKRVLQDEVQLKQCLNLGLPVIFGFSVYESFENDDVKTNGIVVMPAKTERLMGGHCVMLVGYDNNRKVWIVRNSWGSQWGDNGYCYMPFEYLLSSDLASDFWTVQKISEN